MSFLDRVRGRQPSVKTSLFRLTETGREKLGEFSGNTDSRILIAIEASGGSLKLDEIASQAQVSRGKLEHLLPIMCRQGLISIAGGGEEL